MLQGIHSVYMPVSNLCCSLGGGVFGSSTYVAQLLCGNISYATLQRGIHWHWPIAINAVAVFAVSVAVALSIKEPSVGRFFNQRKVQHSLQGLRESPKSSLQVHCISPCFRYANPTIECRRCACCSLMCHPCYAAESGLLISYQRKSVSLPLLSFTASRQADQII